MQYIQSYFCNDIVALISTFNPEHRPKWMAVMAELQDKLVFGGEEFGFMDDYGNEYGFWHHEHMYGGIWKSICKNIDEEDRYDDYHVDEEDGYDDYYCEDNPNLLSFTVIWNSHVRWRIEKNYHEVLDEMMEYLHEREYLRHRERITGWSYESFKMTHNYLMINNNDYATIYSRLQILQ